ncbi:Bax inhibitor 1 [Camellia lanceoleosa]|uniref:Bax inhibitor 1 n=1 Tax=Camellia lanceoleosa TaxID=1840588 RepID=A0ACC0HLN6_9ERIC|nr:Bax inhibitor 1 [Camellia lanceoleosa]
MAACDVGLMILSRTCVRSLRSSKPISNRFISHSLCCALIASAAGACLHILWNIGGLLTTLGYLGSIVWLPSTPPYEEQQKRVSLLMVDALFEGASIAPLIELAIEIDPR